MDNENIFEEIKAEPVKRFGRRKIILFSAVFLLVLAIGILFYNAFFSPVADDGTVVTIEIPEGSNATRIANQLKDSGLIKSPRLFLMDLKRSGEASSLKFGTYEITKGMTNSEIIDLLSKGSNVQLGMMVTIPEGYSLERIEALLIEKGLVTKEEFQEAVFADYDFDFLKTIPQDNAIKYPLQGFLFPSTYLFSYDMSAREMIEMMLKEFEKQITSADISYDNLYETITLASLVEREAKLADERAKIAGVIKNRIENGMRLQIDASVVYVISDGMYDVERVYYRDLEIDSPYNTYKYYGLPKGPVCSPGIASIIASENPEIHDYLYYRTDNEKADGSHIFTKTFDEHKSAAN